MQRKFWITGFYFLYLTWKRNKKFVEIINMLPPDDKPKKNVIYAPRKKETLRSLLGSMYFSRFWDIELLHLW